MKEKPGEITIKDQLKQFGCPIITEHGLWETLYSCVVNSDTERWAAHNLKLLRSEQEDIGRILTPELEEALRTGELGIRLEGVYLMALSRSGEKISQKESLFIPHNFDTIKGDEGGPWES